MSLFNCARFSLVILDHLPCSYKAVGIRLDSGDLAYLSFEARKFFCTIEKEFGVLGFGKMIITASNDLNEETLDALNKQVIVLTQRCFKQNCFCLLLWNLLKGIYERKGVNITMVSFLKIFAVCVLLYIQ